MHVHFVEQCENRIIYTSMIVNETKRGNNLSMCLCHMFINIRYSIIQEYSSGSEDSEIVRMEGVVTYKCSKY